MDWDTLSAEDCKDLANYAERCERFDDMVKATKSMVNKLDRKMTTEERNLLSVAYKNVVGSRRTAWRIFSAMEQKKSSTPTQLITDYKKIIKEELKEHCMDVIGLLDSKVIDKIHDEDDDSRVFFRKMKGDYYRYIAEIEGKDERKETVEEAKAAYNKAYEISQKTLPPHSASRLGLALNYSVFHYEIAEDSTEACSLAKKAFDDAIHELDSMDDNEGHKDSSLILQLLRDNLTLWSEDAKDDDSKDDDSKDDD